jgi:hypothetical protein
MRWTHVELRSFLLETCAYLKRTDSYADTVCDCAFVQLLLYYVRPACPTSEDTGMLGPGKFPL